MSNFRTINKGHSLLGKWYVKLLTLDKELYPNNYVRLFSNIKCRSFFRLVSGEPTIPDFSADSIGVHCRTTPTDELTFCYVNNLSIGRCADSGKMMLIGEVLGYNPRIGILEDVDYSISVSGATFDGVLTEIDYFTVDRDYSDKYEPFTVASLTPINMWLENYN